jgi:hypothetical protein
MRRPQYINKLLYAVLLFFASSSWFKSPRLAGFWVNVNELVNPSLPLQSASAQCLKTGPDTPILILYYTRTSIIMYCSFRVPDEVCH